MTARATIVPLLIALAACGAYDAAETPPAGSSSDAGDASDGASAGDASSSDDGATTNDDAAPDAGTVSLYRSAVMADAPIAYWRLAELPAATQLADERNALPGTTVGGLALGVPGALVRDSNTAARFDGVDACADFETAAIDPSKGISLEAWVKPDGSASDARTILAVYDSRAAVGGPAAGWALDQLGAGVTFMACPGDAACTLVTPGSLLATATFTHVVATLAAGVARIYFDGAEVASGVSSPGPTTTSLPVTVGCRSKGNYFDGVLDEPAIYDRALTAVAIKAHYDAR